LLSGQPGRVFFCQRLAGIRQFDFFLGETITIISRFPWCRFDRQDRGSWHDGIHRCRKEQQAGGQG
jgi:hypothetical protein